MKEKDYQSRKPATRAPTHNYNQIEVVEIVKNGWEEESRVPGKGEEENDKRGEESLPRQDKNKVGTGWVGGRRRGRAGQALRVALAGLEQLRRVASGVAEVGEHGGVAVGGLVVEVRRERTGEDDEGVATRRCVGVSGVAHARHDGVVLGGEVDRALCDSLKKMSGRNPIAHRSTFKISIASSGGDGEKCNGDEDAELRGSAEADGHVDRASTQTRIYFRSCFYRCGNALMVREEGEEWV